MGRRVQAPVTRYEIQLAIDGALAPGPEPEGPLGEKVIDELRRAARAAPTEPDYHFILGSALAREGRLDQARAAFREACAGHPTDAAYRRALGECEWRLGRFEAAADAFREVLNRDPLDDEARNGLAMSLLRSGQPGAAVEVLRPAVQRNPSRRPEWHSNLGGALWEEGRIAEAERSFQNAVRLGASEAAYKRNLGRLLLEQKRPGDAKRWLKASLAQDDQNAPAWVSLGDALLALGRRGEAETAYARGASLDPAVFHARPASQAAWQALRLQAARHELRGTHDAPPLLPRLGLALGSVVGRVVTALAHSTAARVKGAVVLGLVLAVGRLVLVVLPPYVAHYRLHDDVVRVARAPTKDEAVVREGVSAAFARHLLGSATSMAGPRIATAERWRSVEADYSVRVEPLPGLSIPLAFRLRVHEPYFVEAAPKVF
jgi:tetratricopeptide (TPR) repeat protein